MVERRKERIWAIRRYKEGDEKQIIQLLDLVFRNIESEKLEEKYWRWEFIDGPFGDAKIWVAEDDDKIVGHYAAIPMRVKVDKEIITGAIVVDVMTHPDYRYQGMFASLGERATKDAGMEGLHFFMGYPTRKNVIPGHLKVGWFIVGSIPVLVKPLILDNIIRRYIKNKILHRMAKSLANIALKVFFRTKKIEDVVGVSIHAVSSFDEQVDDFWQKTSNSYRFIGVRDKKFLNWKFVDNPYRKYKIFIAKKDEKIIGYIVLRVVRKSGINGVLIVDMLTLPDYINVSAQLIDTAIDYCNDNGIDVIGCLMPKNTLYFKILKKKGFIKTPKKYGFIIHINSSRVTREQLDNMDGWFLTWGDIDVV